MKISKAMTALLALISCGGQQGPQHYGQISVALTSTGTDGSIYRLPDGTELDLANTSGGNFNLSVGLDGSAPEIDVPVVAGSYDASLADQNGDTVTWTLNKVDGGGNVIGTVQATLLTAMPVSLTVTANVTTPLVFAFRIPSGGVITFQRGTVAVSVTVTNGTATSYSGELSTAFNISHSFFPGDTVGATLQARMAPALTAPLSVDIGGALTGSWVEEGGVEDLGGTSLLVCSQADFTIHGATGPQAFVDLIAETGGGSDPNSVLGGSVFCLYDTGSVNWVRIRSSRTGFPTTPTFSDLTSDQMYYRITMIGILPNRPYNGVAGTLDLGMLMADSASGFPLTSTNSIVDDATDGTNLTELFLSFNFTSETGVTMSFIGH